MANGECGKIISRRNVVRSRGLCHDSAIIATAVLIALIPSEGVQGIVRRHDRDDARFVELARKFPAVAQVGKDGCGVLVGPRWVLTAAHVAKPLKPGESTVSFGEKVIVVAEVRIHPDARFDPNMQAPPEPDMALLKLESEPAGIIPVEIYRKTDEAGKLMYIVGNGDVGDGRSAPARGDRIMRAGENVPHEVRPIRILFKFDEPPAGSELEAVSGPGDSGGPALLVEGDKVFVAGVSSGSTGGKPGRYGVTDVYMRVSSYADWISRTIGT